MNNNSFLKISLLILNVFSFVNSNAQDSLRFKKNETKTLFGNKPHSGIRSIGFYVAPEFQYANTNGSYNPMGAMSFMFMINKRFAMGPSMGHSNGHDFGNRSNYGGLKLEYTVLPNSLVHLSFPIIIGHTSNSDPLVYANNYNFQGKGGMGHGGRNEMRNGGMLIQPGVNAEVNVFKNLKWYAGASYRIVNADNATLNSGMSFNTGLKLGVFDHRLHKKMPHHRPQF